MRLRIATFNLESWDDIKSDDQPDLEQRIEVIRPMLRRADADVLCLQEIGSQEAPDGKARDLHALDQLLDKTPYARDMLRDSMAGDESVEIIPSFELVMLKAVMERRRVVREGGMEDDHYALIREQYRAWRSGGEGLRPEWKQAFELAGEEIMAVADLGEYDILDQ